jgi:mycothiol synthase
MMAPMTDAVPPETAIPGLRKRPFDPAADFAPVAALISDVNAVDGVAWAPNAAGLAIEWAPVPSFVPARDVLLAELDGDLVGAVRTGWRVRAGKVVHRIEIWIRAEVRRRGIGRSLLGWAEDHVAALVRDGDGGPAAMAHELGVSAEERNVAATAFATSAGYRPVRYGFEMRRALAEPIPDARLPAGLEIRPVRTEDHRVIWNADAEAFQDHWEADIPYEEDFVAFFAHPDRDTSLWRVAWDGDQVAGVVMNGIYPEESARIGIELGWLDSVAVRRPWRRRGLASALVVASLRALRDRGMAVAALGVDAESPTGALALYEGLGFRRHQAWVTYRKSLRTGADPAA